MGKKLFSRLAQFSPKILANLTQIYSYLVKLGKIMHQINFDFPAIFVKFKATSKKNSESLNWVGSLPILMCVSDT